jgi:hypothetical protein
VTTASTRAREVFPPETRRIPPETRRKTPLLPLCVVGPIHDALLLACRRTKQLVSKQRVRARKIYSATAVEVGHIHLRDINLGSATKTVPRLLASEEAWLPVGKWRRTREG